MPYFIKSKNPQGRYRAGQFHSAKGRVWPDSALTREQRVSIKKDAVLVFEQISEAEAEAKRKEIGQTEQDAEKTVQDAEGAKGV